jgi:ElaB/YqjD/DUF883 family membrane-anchored ribosome-binding protein
MNQKDIERMQDQLDELSDRLEKMGGETVDEIGDKSARYAREFKEKAADAWEKSKYARKKVSEFAEENPWVWMVAGVGLGLMLGMAAGRKTCSHWK